MNQLLIIGFAIVCAVTYSEGGECKKDLWSNCEKDLKKYCTSASNYYKLQRGCCKTCKGAKIAVRVNGGWGRWGRYQRCSKPCGVGIQTRKRRCNSPAPANGGWKCRGTNQQRRTCNTKRCSKGKREALRQTRRDNMKCLKDANKYRSWHRNTPRFKYDPDLEQKAQKWADYLSKNDLWKHDPKNSRYKVGENLYQDSNSKSGGKSLYCARADKLWYAEINDYNWRTGGKKSSKAIGHFTQMVWDTTIKVGFGYAFKPDPSNPDNTKAIVVAKYSPPGNYRGKNKEHVKPRKRSGKDELVEDDIVEDQDEVEETKIWADEMAKTEADEVNEEEPEELAATKPMEADEFNEEEPEELAATKPMEADEFNEEEPEELAATKPMKADECDEANGGC